MNKLNMNKLKNKALSTPPNAVGHTKMVYKLLALLLTVSMVLPTTSYPVYAASHAKVKSLTGEIIPGGESGTSNHISDGYFEIELDGYVNEGDYIDIEADGISLSATDILIDDTVVGKLVGTKTLYGWGGVDANAYIVDYADSSAVEEYINREMTSDQWHWYRITFNENIESFKDAKIKVSWANDYLSDYPVVYPADITRYIKIDGVGQIEKTSHIGDGADPVTIDYLLNRGGITARIDGGFPEVIGTNFQILQGNRKSLEPGDIVTFEIDEETPIELIPLKNVGDTYVYSGYPLRYTSDQIINKYIGLTAKPLNDWELKILEIGEKKLTVELVRVGTSGTIVTTGAITHARLTDISEETINLDTMLTADWPLYGTITRDNEIIYTKEMRMQWILRSTSTDSSAVLEKFSVDTKASSGGTIDNSATVNYGRTITINYAPEVGYKLNTLTVDGKSVDITKYPTSYTFEKIKEDHEVKAEFVVDTLDISGKLTWVDNNNQDGIRPDKAKVNLLADGKTIDSKEISIADGWSYKFTDLPKYNGDKLISYSITPSDIPEYVSTISGYNINSTHEVYKTSVRGAKVWEDKDNQDGIRPDEITINLIADGSKVDSIKAYKETGYEYSFANLDLRKAGKDINYEITESPVDEYETEIERSGNDFTITNSYTPGVTSVLVTKAWDDNDDQDGIRTNGVDVILLADGEQVGEPVHVYSTYSWNGVPINKPEGQKIVYTVEEINVPEGYEPVITGSHEEGFEITNVHIPETIDIAGKKIWDDSDNQDGKRPESVRVLLYANDEVIDYVDVYEPWEYEFTNLPKYEKGEEMEYKVEEIEVPKYETSYDGFDITNTHIPEVKDTTVTKVWDDGDNQDGIRPESVEITLLSNGEELETVTLSEDNNLTHMFEALPVYSEGEEIVYEVTEAEVDGYETEITLEDNSFTVTNTHVPEVITIQGKKIWNDNNNQDGFRPMWVKIGLFANDEKVDEVSISDPWEYAFKDVPKYSNGEEIVYTVAEEKVSEYDATYDGFDITNTHVPYKVNIAVKKVWDDNDNQDGIRPDEVKVILKANDEEIEEATLNADNQFRAVFSGLPEYEQGKKIKYEVSEVEVEGYESVIEKSDSGYVITNTHTPEVISITGTKTWDDANNQDGVRPSEITVNLLANGEKVDSKVIKVEGNTQEFTFSDVPKFSDGKEIVYTVTEDEVSEYVTKIDGFNITNTHTLKVKDIEITKKWDDKDDKDKLRPESIKVMVLANGKDYKEVTVTKDGNWTTKITVPEYSEGKEVSYTIKEVDTPKGYTAKVSGFTITNTHKVAEAAPKTGDMERGEIMLFILTACLIGVVSLRRKRRA